MWDWPEQTAGFFITCRERERERQTTVSIFGHVGFLNWFCVVVSSFAMFNPKMMWTIFMSKLLFCLNQLKQATNVEIKEVCLSRLLPSGSCQYPSAIIHWLQFFSASSHTGHWSNNNCSCMFFSMFLFGGFKMVRIHRSIDIPLHAIAMAITIVASSLQATVLIQHLIHLTSSLARQRRKH